MTNFCEGWYLIYTKPRHEKKVHSRLSEINIKSFLPMRKVLRNWRDRKKYIEEPLFPSYVFIYLNDHKGFYECMDTEGYLHYVRMGKEIVRVGDSVVDSIRLAVDHARDIEVSEARFQPGRQLVISDGALTGLSCEVVQVRGGEKILVRVELLQRNLLLTLPAENLLPV